MDLFLNMNHHGYSKHAMTKVNDHHPRHRKLWLDRECLVCGSQAIGMNFGAPTCAPCKAFFRRNARRKEILETTCNHGERTFFQENNFDFDEKTLRYLQIRRCTSCRLHRCFEVGMREDLIRSEEENERHKQLVNANRRRRELLRHHDKTQLVICQPSMDSRDTLTTIDWTHLSNIVSAYETYGIKTYIAERAKISFPETSLRERTIQDYAMLPMSITLSLSAFIRSLPAFQSLPRSAQKVLCESNLRRLMGMNLHELNQSCFTEPSQIATFKKGWEFICGPELYQQFIHIDNLAEKLIIADPIVTRLWLVVLFFSTPLCYFYDPKSYVTKMKKSIPCVNIQHQYVTLLWKYLIFRHGDIQAIRIYSNLIQIYLNMLRFGLQINMRFRTRIDFRAAHDALEKLTTFDTTNHH